MKYHKVWIETELYDSVTSEYTRGIEPLDIKCHTEREAIKLQVTLHEIGRDIITHYGKEPHGS